MDTKRAAIPVGIKEAHLQVFIQPTTPPGVAYGELNRVVVASSTHITSGMERCDRAVASQSRSDGKKAGTGLDSNQCA